MAGIGADVGILARLGGCLEVEDVFSAGGDLRSGGEDFGDWGDVVLFNGLGTESKGGFDDFVERIGGDEGEVVHEFSGVVVDDVDGDFGADGGGEGLAVKTHAGEHADF